MKINANFIKDAMNGLRDVYVADRKIAESIKGARHLRNGKITKEDSKELAGTPVHALGVDELGNLIYVDAAGYIRQHITQ